MTTVDNSAIYSRMILGKEQLEAIILGNWGSSLASINFLKFEAYCRSRKFRC